MTAASELLDFKPSPIHGTGGFALRDIAARTRVVEYAGEKIDKQQSLARCQRGNPCIFYLDEQWNLDGSVEWNSARFLNHSCSPNCEADLIDGQVWIVTKRAVAAGEEVTFNYGYDLIDYEEHACRCGERACIGFIVAEEFFDHLRARHRPMLPENS